MPVMSFIREPVFASRMCQNRTEAEIPKCGRDAEKCGKISENRRDVASTYVLRPRLGINCPGFWMVRKKDLGKEWTEGVRTEYRILV